MPSPYENARAHSEAPRVSTATDPTHAQQWIDGQFPTGLKRFEIRSPDGGVNHFHAKNVAEGFSTLHDAVRSTNADGRFGYSIHHVDPSDPRDNLNLGGGSVYSKQANPNDPDQRPLLIHDHEGHNYRPDLIAK